MKIGTAIKEARARHGVTQEDLKQRLRYSREMISAIENGRRRVPEESLPELARWSPMLAMVIAEEHTGGTLPLVYLDGDIDRHPLAMTEKAIEEGEEFLEAVRGLRLVNKTSAKKLTPEDREKLTVVRQEAWESVICKLNWLAETAQIYEIDMAEEYRRVVQKLENAGYKKVQKRKNPLRKR